jgi:hypothetical protein
MTEELLRQVMVEIRYWQPFALRIPAASRTDCVDMWMESCRISEGLNDRDHTRTKALFLEGDGGHELLDGLVGDRESREARGGGESKLSTSLGW